MENCLYFIAFFSAILSCVVSETSDTCYKWGCRFWNCTTYEVSDDDNGCPVYGNENAIKPLVFDFITIEDFEYFEKFLTDLKKLNEKVIVEEFTNNMDPFFQLIQEYKISKKINAIGFEDFFKTYQPKYDRFNQDYAEQSVDLLERIDYQLEKKYPGISKSTFLSATIFTKRLGTLLNEINKEDKRFRTFNYFVATIKISVRRLNENKIKFSNKKTSNGYILLLPGKSLVNPIVVLEDRQSPHSGTHFITLRSVNEWIEFVLHDSQYIFTSRMEKGRSFDYVIFVKSPYCSFLFNTVKINLSNMFKYIFKRNKNGRKIAEMKFRLDVIKDKEPENREFSVYAYKPNSDSILVNHTLSNLTDGRQFTKLEREIIDTFESVFELTKTEENIYSKIEAVRSFYRNGDLLKILAGLEYIQKSYFLDPYVTNECCDSQGCLPKFWNLMEKICK